MKHLIRSILLLFFVLSLTSTQAKTLKVLFVGNSYTYVNDMPELLKAMAKAKGHELEYVQQTPGGRNFQEHWEEGVAVKKMKQGNFDVVVLQNHSFEPVIEPERMMKYGKLLAAAADKAGARKIYYLTMAYAAPVDWMKKDNDYARRGAALFPEMYERLVESYSRLASETDGDIAPVGLAWKLAYKAKPHLELHAPDHSHAAPAGAYLTALVLYSSLYDAEPEKMPRNLTVKSAKFRLDSKIQKTLEAAARKACQTFPKP